MLIKKKYSDIEGGEGINFIDGVISLNHLNIENLSDPNQTTLMYWDDENDRIEWLVVGSGLEISDSEIEISSHDHSVHSNIDDSEVTDTQILAYDAESGLYKPVDGYELTNDLSEDEIEQLQNIDSVTISNTQWAYVGNLSSQPMEDLSGKTTDDLSEGEDNLYFFSHDNSEHTEDYITGYTVTESDVTQHEEAINHDALENFLSGEHIDWTISQDEDVHEDNYTDTDTQLSDSEVIGIINGDDSHGSDASHNYFSGSHDDLSNVSSGDHHTRYTDSEAEEAINNDTDHGSTASHDYTTDTRVDVSEDGTLIVDEPTDINFTDSGDATVTVSDDGDGTVSVDVSATDTDTTYTAGSGIDLSDEEFSLDAHDIAGDFHSESDLSELNDKISDATLDDSGESRPPEDHNNDAHTEDYIVGISEESIRDLSDVQDTAPSEGQIPKWNDADGEFQPSEDQDTTYDAGSGIVLSDGEFSLDEHDNDAHTEDYITGYTVTEPDVTQHEEAIDHDATKNYVADEHIDWTESQEEDVHEDNYTDTTYVASDFEHDKLSEIPVNDHLDWTESQSEDIHSDNYTDTDTTYTAGSGIDLSDEEFSLDTHDIAGDFHSSSSLSELNDKISDATLDKVGDSRPPEDHNNDAHSENYVSDTVKNHGSQSGSITVDVDDGRTHTVEASGDLDITGDNLDEVGLAVNVDNTGGHTITVTSDRTLGEIPDDAGHFSVYLEQVGSDVQAVISDIFE